MWVIGTRTCTRPADRAASWRAKLARMTKRKALLKKRTAPLQSMRRSDSPPSPSFSSTPAMNLGALLPCPPPHPSARNGHLRMALSAARARGARAPSRCLCPSTACRMVLLSRLPFSSQRSCQCAATAVLCIHLFVMRILCGGCTSHLGLAPCPTHRRYRCTA